MVWETTAQLSVLSISFIHQFYPSVLFISFTHQFYLSVFSVSFICQFYLSVLSISFILLPVCDVSTLAFSTSSSEIIGHVSSFIIVAFLCGYLIICAVNILLGDCSYSFVQTFIVLQSCCIFNQRLLEFGNFRILFVV